MKQNNKFRIAVPNKGRLYQPTIDLLRDIGLEFDIDDRKLSSQVSNFDLEILYASALNIPEYVQDGIVDLGITGYDLVCERGADVSLLRKLHFGHTDLVIAAPEQSSIKKIEDLEGKKIATGFGHLTKKFLTKNKIKAEIIDVRGAVEITPELGLADAIADLRSSGSSLKMNKLKALETILESEAVLIANKDSLVGRKNSIDTLTLRIESVLTASAKKYLMMNAHEELLPAIKDVAPGLSSPTIMKLSREGMIAVHSVVDAKDVWMIIEKLKKIGATGILIMPIDQMIY
ncbi:MAG: ATP phosphoribosyltransferase [Candidatus Vogelbacteria bacterium]|nr:ATP phosphoribosyltransferase [Candidatus Vogelbacteria bacterium]